MKKFVSVHYVNFKSSSELSHNMRTQKEPKHLLPPGERLPNVLDLDSRKNFNKILKKAKKSNPRSFQKNAKPNIDMVMNWSFDQVEKNIKQYGIETYNKMIMERVKIFTNNIQNEFGLTFVSMNLHNDEGKIINGKTKLNQHCHINFLDFDFKKNKRVLRTLSKSDLRKWQQLSEDAFKDLGFEKGLNQNKNKHIKDLSSAIDQVEMNTEQILESLDIDNKTILELQSLKEIHKDNKLVNRYIVYAIRMKKKYKEHKDDLNFEYKEVHRMKAIMDKCKNKNYVPTNEEKNDFKNIANNLNLPQTKKSFVRFLK